MNIRLPVPLVLYAAGVGADDVRLGSSMHSTKVWVVLLVDVGLLHLYELVRILTRHAACFLNTLANGFESTVAAIDRGISPSLLALGWHAMDLSLGDQLSVVSLQVLAREQLAFLSEIHITLGCGYSGVNVGICGVPQMTTDHHWKFSLHICSSLLLAEVIKVLILRLLSIEIEAGSAILVSI